MSMTTRVAPIAVAGVAGIFVGWLLAPNVTAVREDFAARFNEQTPLIQQLQSSVADIEARLGTMPDAASLNASIQEQLSASEGRLATQTQALGAQLGEQAGAAPEAVTTGLEEVRTGIEDLRAEVETIGSEITTLREEGAAAAAASAQAPEDEAGRLASEIGASGAVLLPGQGAIFGGNRVDLLELDVEAGTASITPEGGEASDVSAGDTIELSPGCTIRLAGIASNAAYLEPETCSETGTQAAPVEDAAAPAEVAPAETQPVESAPAEGQQANQPPVGEAPAGEQQPGTDVPSQGAQAVPDQQPGQAQENAPNAGQPQGGQPQPTQ